jgi:hypothetical protein
LQAEAPELPPDHHQVLGLDVADSQFSLGRGGQCHEAGHLDVIGADAVLGPAELVAPVDRDHVGADAVDPRAHLDQQAGQVLYMGLAGGIRDRRWALGERRRHQGVLRGHHRGLVHEDPARPQLAVSGGDLDPSLAVDLRPHVAEGVEMGVQTPPANEVATRGRHPGPAEARQERPRE